MKPSSGPGFSLAQTGGGAADFAQALDLADRFDDDPQFSGGLLSAAISMTRDEGQEPATPADTRRELASDLRARAFAALASHAERHGDASPFKVIEAPADPEELLAKMTEIVRQDHGPVLDLLEMIRQRRAPLGVLSTMLGHPYSSTLALRGLGYFIAARWQRRRRRGRRGRCSRRPQRRRRSGHFSAAGLVRARRIRLRARAVQDPALADGVRARHRGGA